jgi:hypothetical protein
VARIVSIEGGRAVPLTEEKFLDESALQRLLEETPELITLDDVETAPLPLLTIGREVPLGGLSLDLLFIDASGRLTAVEAKLRRNPEIRRQVVAQVIEYAAHLSAWSAEDVERQASHYLNARQTPEAFSGAPLCAALNRLTGTSSQSDLDEKELRARIAARLKQRDFRLIVAVDHIVDSLRAMASFLDRSSTFAFYLLEVQEHKAAGLHVASINLYGSAEGKQGHAVPDKAVWNEEKFFEALARQAGELRAGLVRDLYGFIHDNADAVVWGVGATEGSAGFGVRRGGEKFTIFNVTTRGKVWISLGSLNRRLPKEVRAQLLAKLRAIGLDAADSLLENPNAWLTYDVATVGSPELLSAFKTSILTLVEQIS